jgi:hypothetical protein
VQVLFCAAPSSRRPGMPHRALWLGDPKRKPCQGLAVPARPFLMASPASYGPGDTKRKPRQGSAAPARPFLMASPASYGESWMVTAAGSSTAPPTACG